MKNKIMLKKLIITFICMLFFSSSFFIGINLYEYHKYNNNYNNKLTSIISLVQEKYPNVTEKEIFEIINSNNDNSSIIKKYSIDLKNVNLVKNNNLLSIKFIIWNVIIYILTAILILLLFLKFNKRKDIEINKITKCIEKINKKEYELDIEDINEDELSILKNEIYKTTINLKELAEISTKEKIELKKSLSDISHQIKTPLTSISIILDNLIDDPNMNNQTKEEFLKDIKRELNNINFLVQSILKLSKLDTNTIDFNKQEVKLYKIINESIKNISMLGDLKGVTIETRINNDCVINCDYKWQVEAISNILKNCVEHAFNNSVVEIKVEGNKVYSSISITNSGIEIDKNDLPHIFERFYKGKNCLPDSIGIGLSLSKALIEKDNGKISVTSKNNKTKFTIKYY